MWTSITLCDDNDLKEYEPGIDAYLGSSRSDWSVKRALCKTHIKNVLLSNGYDPNLVFDKDSDGKIAELTQLASAYTLFLIFSELDGGAAEGRFARKKDTYRTLYEWEIKLLFSGAGIPYDSDESGSLDAAEEQVASGHRMSR